MSDRLEVFPIDGIPEIKAGDDLAQIICDAAKDQLRDGDVLVVAQKAVSKAEGAFADLSQVTPGPRALELSAGTGRDPRMVQLALDESVDIVRDNQVLIVETKHGYICANAGIDRSNIPGEDIVTLLPQDSDRSAEQLRTRIKDATGASVAVIVSDTFGRPFRTGLANVALGIAGMSALIDYAGHPDDYGRTMQVTAIAAADELAACAEIVMGKVSRRPAIVIRGFIPDGDNGSGKELIRPRDDDMFR